MKATPENLRAQASAAGELIAMLQSSADRDNSLRCGHREPFHWGTASARDLVALLAKLAAEGEAETGTHE